MSRTPSVKGRVVRFQLLKNGEDGSEAEDSRATIHENSSDDAEDEEGDIDQKRLLLTHSQSPPTSVGWGGNRKSQTARNVCRCIVVLVSVALLVSMFLAVIIALANNERSKRVSSNATATPRTTLAHVTSLLSLYCNQSKVRSLPKLEYDGLCSRITLKPKWENHFTGLSTESAIRFIDINCDGTLDIILGFGLRQDDFDGHGFNFFKKCIYSDTTSYLPYCLGGILALDGQSGHELWRKQTTHEIFAIHCVLDVNSDGQMDCIITGRGGAMFAIEPRTAEILWLGDIRATNYSWNIMTAQIVKDFDHDTVQDIVVSHGGDTRYKPYEQPRGTGRLLLISGKTGEVISLMPMPDGLETYMSPIIHQGQDGKKYVLFGTGGETISGSLWSVELEDFAQLGFHCSTTEDHVSCIAVASSTRQIIQGVRNCGVSNPPALVDLTGDDLLDIVVPMYDGRVFALNGKDYSVLWPPVEFVNAQSYIHPAIGNFNDDDIPDIMAIYQRGYYPFYNTTIVAIIDGLTGDIVYYSETPVGMKMAVSPLALKSKTGKDLFVYWKPKETSSLINTSPARRRRHGSNDNNDDDDDDQDYHKKSWFNDIQLLVKSCEVQGEGWVLQEEHTGINQLNQLNQPSSALQLTMAYGLISSPSVTDLDGDGKLDMVYAYVRRACKYHEKERTFNISDMEPLLETCHDSILDIFAKELDSDCPFAPLESQQWLSYLGTYGDGMYGM